jgi:UDP-N-acetylglucosamine 2-epimerase (non-hydrolysing)
MIRTLLIFGTRPEAIKLCPLVRHLQGCADFEARVCVTAQHRSMLDQVLDAFQIVPDHDLDLMAPGQTLSQSTSRILSALEPVIAKERPDVVLVQGDTTTTMAGALAAFYQHAPIGHIEAGLRTFDLTRPFPEEMNRVVTTRLAALHFAPTRGSAQNLRAEHVAENRIFVTGNTGIDAVVHVSGELAAGRLRGRDWAALDPRKKLVVITAHRRESFGDGIGRIVSALTTLSKRRDVQIVFPVHRNPSVLDVVTTRLGGLPNVLLLEPLDYLSFVDLMRRARLLLTDSGGIQEEGPSLGKPVLVMRDTTERPEAIEAGTARLVGTDESLIVSEVSRLLDDEDEYERMTRIHNPYGDGHACERIAAAIRTRLGDASPRPDDQLAHARLPGRAT